ncbi:MAG: diacylglycerol kinase [Fimbriiglobus sp.]
MSVDPQEPVKRDVAWQVAPTLWSSFRYAWMGLRYAFLTQRNFRIHTVAGISVTILGVLLQLTPVELAVIALTCGAVITMELANTAIEAVVDLTVKQSFHELAKVAKDCAAAAVMVTAIVAIVVAGCLILPKLLVSINLFLGS